jgi:TRAP-type C4-dicarboxylate transport system substrate-binding protein
MTLIRTAATLAAAFVLSTQAVDARELRFASSAPEATPWGKSYNAFGELVKQKSGGSLTIKIFGSAQLGDEQTTIRQTARGRIDMVGASNTAGALMVPEFALLAAPFLWDNEAQGDCVADKHLLKVFAPMFDQKNLVPLAFVEVGQQILFTTFPATVPADLAGKKVRTAPVKTDTIYIGATGATPVPLGVADAMPALKTGGVSATTWPTVYGIAVGYHKVATNVVVTNHSHQRGGFFISKQVWKSLSAKEQQWVQEAATESTAALRQGIRGAEAALLKKAAAEGATVYRPEGATAKAWRILAGDVTDQIVKESGGKGAAIWKQIQAAKAECSR